MNNSKRQSQEIIITSRTSVVSAYVFAHNSYTFNPADIRP